MSGFIEGEDRAQATLTDGCSDRAASIPVSSSIPRPNCSDRDFIPFVENLGLGAAVEET